MENRHSARAHACALINQKLATCAELYAKTYKQTQKNKRTMKKTEVDIDVANWINEHRKKKGWTQKQLAKQLDVSQPLINHWEKGRQRPNAEMREKLVEVFGAGFGEEETFGRTLGEWLRSKREKQKLTIRELADKAELS